MLENKVKAALDTMALRNARGNKHHCKPHKLKRMIVSYEIWEVSHRDHPSLLISRVAHVVSLPHHI